jgi:hypothetical protein
VHLPQRGAIKGEGRGATNTDMRAAFVELESALGVARPHAPRQAGRAVPLLRLHLPAAALAVLAGCAGAPAPALAPADLGALLGALRAAVPLNAPGLDGDPYRAWRGRTPPAAPPAAVCGVRFEADAVHYRLTTFPDAAAARAEGFATTHVGTCGTCSTMQDLAVYLARPDLTAPVRRCGIKLSGERNLSCLEALGFSPACARTWYFNAMNTRRECFTTCAWAWARGTPSAEPDGRLNACLQCDEERSGPVFKATAGRTRRNSGIRSSIPRPDEQIADVVRDDIPVLPAVDGSERASQASTSSARKKDSP